MLAQVGQIYEGTVTGLTSFGAFVKLSTGESGMVHISEVAAVYVKEIREHLTEGQTVQVKVLGVNENNKISLSIKQTLPPPEADERQKRRPSQRSHRPQTWQGRPPADTSNMSFEDMMARFKQVSDEKMSDLKRSSPDTKSGRRGGGGGR